MSIVPGSMGDEENEDGELESSSEERLRLRTMVKGETCRFWRDGC